ncbi:MAG: diguanylate cyclase [Candidatus Atribacteria bacterium]|nr:diguanylate cyclase [Candidatus Atribacteria bacterium]
MRTQRETEEKKILERIVAISEEFLQSAGSKLNYQKITDNILDISGAKYAVFNLYEEDGCKFRTVAFSAPEGIIKKVSSLLGFKLIGKKWDYDPARTERIKAHIITRFSTLSELLGDRVAKPVVSLMEKTFNTGEVFLVKMLKENVMLGDFILIMSRNVKFKNDNYVEIYTRQVGLLITRKKATEALQESEDRYRNLFAYSRDAIMILEPPSWNFTSVNPATLEIFKAKNEAEFLLRGPGELSPELQPDGRASCEKAKEMNETALRKGSHFFEWVHKRTNGEEFTAEVLLSRIEQDGKVFLQAVVRDITGRKQAEEALRESVEKFSKAFQTSPYAIIITRAKDGKFIETNDAFTSYTGFTREEAAAGSSINLKLWVDRENREWVISALKEGVEVKDKEFQFRKKNGEIMIGLFSAQIIHINNEPFILSSINDITERKNTENEILHLSYHDQLTGLYNRRFAEEEIKRLDTKRQLPLSVIMGDLNSLKLTNDTFGHSIGDRLLKEIAELLKKLCRSEDILARWGGDEFVILLPKTSNTDSEEIVQRIKKECSKLIIQKIPLSLSIGIATKIEAGQGIDEIIIEAESNMYKNKLIQKVSDGSSIISALEQTLYEKSNETMEHAFRIKDSAIKLGKSIKLHSNQLGELSLLASLHDIGKVATPETILLKEGKLTEKEWAVIKRHPEIGFNIAQSSPQIIHIAKFILACHENWDGSGYPHGLAGQSIPIVSRIMSIADAYDVMTSERTYKKAMSKDTAIEELKRCAGTQFDPVLINKFIEIIAN